MPAETPYLAKQFAFTPTGSQPHWLRSFRFIRSTPCGDLHVGRNMPVTLVGDEEYPLGLWLGWPIAPSGTAPELPTAPASVEDYVYAHNGSFIFVDLSCEEPCFYLDACGSLSLVFDKRNGITASTAWAALGPEGYRDRFIPHRLVEYNVAAHGWIAGSDTAHEDVLRVMANHRLYPNSGRIDRHWAMQGVEQGAKPETALDTIANECRDVLHPDCAFRRSGDVTHGRK